MLDQFFISKAQAYPLLWAQHNPWLVALEPLIAAVLDQVSETARVKGLRLRVRLQGHGVHTDAAVLHTVLSNLMSNAVRYTQHGGVLLAARRRGDRVLLQVWDTGIGIAADDASSDLQPRQVRRAAMALLAVSLIMMVLVLFVGVLLCHGGLHSLVLRWRLWRASPGASHAP
mgnify:CR=1 FL=1